MRRTTPALYSVLALLMALAGFVALAAAIQSLTGPAAPDKDAVLFALLAVPSAALAFARRPGASRSFALAFILAASVLFPPGEAVFIAVLSGWLSAPLARGVRQTSAAGLLEEGGLRSGTLATMAAASAAVIRVWGASMAPYGPAGWLAMLAGGCLAALAVLLSFGALSVWMKGSREPFEAARLLRTLPAALFSIPLALLLVMNFSGEGKLGFLLLAGLSVVGGGLLRRLEHTRAELSSANRVLERRVEELQGLGEIARRLNTTLTPEQILEAV